MTTPNKQKRKRTTITLAGKQSIIEASETKTTAQLITHFNNKYGESKIRNFVRSKEKIQKAIDDRAGSKRAKLSSVKHPELEEALLKWMKNAQIENVAFVGLSSPGTCQEVFQAPITQFFN
jgi:hypothetical protein